MICKKCNISKTENDFYFIKEKNRLDYTCKNCRNTSLNKVFYQRVRNIKKRYNQNLDDDFRDYLIELWNKQNGKCYYTNIEMSLNGYSKNLNNAMTVDRIDPNLGYTKENVVLCCSIVNKIKQNLSINELLYWCDLIKNNTDRLL